jgi:DNA (cytosine-5)-methyltransferase 1
MPPSINFHIFLLRGVVFNELALFAGVGGGILGGKLLGWRTVCAVEWDEYCAGVLISRQNEGYLDPFPVWDDVRTFDGRPWRGVVDVVSGGFPCQDISVAGSGAGLAGARSGLWVEMARIIGEVRPRYAYVENVPALLVRGFGRILGDLAEMGYDARWGVYGACDVGAPHKRERLWILADAVCEGLEGLSGDDEVGLPQGWEGLFASDTTSQNGICGGEGDIAIADAGGSKDGGWWESEPDVGRMADGVAYRVDRLKSIGNGQVPSVAAYAWSHLISNDEGVGR